MSAQPGRDSLLISAGALAGELAGDPVMKLVIMCGATILGLLYLLHQYVTAPF